MTKEEFAKRCYEICRDKAISSDCEYLYSFIREFFSQNVVIPKGVNRHIDADVLHEWLEDSTKVLEYRDSSLDVWNTTSVLRKANQYRIKPSEPTYEWQWYGVHNDTNKAYISEFITNEEADEANKFAQYEYWTKRIEETKRLRK